MLVFVISFSLEGYAIDITVTGNIDDTRTIDTIFVLGLFENEDIGRSAEVTIKTRNDELWINESYVLSSYSFFDGYGFSIVNSQSEDGFTETTVKTDSLRSNDTLFAVIIEKLRPPTTEQISALIEVSDVKLGESSQNFSSIPFSLRLPEPILLIERLNVSPIFPNPFTGPAELKFSLEKETGVQLILYSVNGKKMAHFPSTFTYQEGEYFTGSLFFSGSEISWPESGRLQKGLYTFRLRPQYERLPSGQYCLYIVTDEESFTQNILFIK
ncbi:MAG: hypothetical protein Kapaf2KO_03710 [Candidatus Kapaibacteriales bacterium]